MEQAGSQTGGQKDQGPPPCTAEGAASLRGCQQHICMAEEDFSRSRKNKEGRMHVVKLTLTVLITFNQRCPSECAELWWSEVEKAGIREEITEILNSVSYAERTISGRYGLLVVA